LRHPQFSITILITILVTILVTVLVTILVTVLVNILINTVAICFFTVVNILPLIVMTQASARSYIPSLVP